MLDLDVELLFFRFSCVHRGPWTVDRGPWTTANLNLSSLEPRDCGYTYVHFFKNGTVVAVQRSTASFSLTEGSASANISNDEQIRFRLHAPILEAARFAKRQLSNSSISLITNRDSPGRDSIIICRRHNGWSPFF